MNELIKDNIIEMLNTTYRQMEGALMEGDITKDDFKGIEKEMYEIAKFIGLEDSFYPYKK